MFSDQNAHDIPSIELNSLVEKGQQCCSDCPFLCVKLYNVKVKVAQSSLTLCGPVDCTECKFLKEN